VVSGDDLAPASTCRSFSSEICKMGTQNKLDSQTSALISCSESLLLGIVVLYSLQVIQETCRVKISASRTFPCKPWKLANHGTRPKGLCHLPSIKRLTLSPCCAACFAALRRLESPHRGPTGRMCTFRKSYCGGKFFEKHVHKFLRRIAELAFGIEQTLVAANAQRD
jgi:hypothetical protein